MFQVIVALILFANNVHFSHGKVKLPEIYETVGEIISTNGYPFEPHIVETSDGYLLGIQRIPFGKNEKSAQGNSNKPVVLLQHGLLDSAHTFLNNIGHQNLAFLLADSGFDVWLSNSRGNTYSKRHNHLNPKNCQFWDFSWQDMSEKDLPALVDYILKITNVTSISYIGHSQGTLIAFAALSENRLLQAKINLFIALAPVTDLAHLTSPIRYVAPYSKTVASTLKFFGSCEFLPNSLLQKVMAKVVCGVSKLSILCENTVFLLAGPDTRNLNETRLPVYLAKLPAGTSVKNMVHFSQMILAQRFQKYDYGVSTNMKIYGQSYPPEYKLSQISTNVALFYGGNDILSTWVDGVKLSKKLPNVVYERGLESYNHLDFVWGIDANKEIYSEVVDLLREYINKK